MECDGAKLLIEHFQVFFLDKSFFFGYPFP